MMRKKIRRYWRYVQACKASDWAGRWNSSPMADMIAVREQLRAAAATALSVGFNYFE